MKLIDIALLFASVIAALISRSSMKRILARRMGRANTSLLEVDFWKATSGEALGRSLVVIEVASWAAIILLVAMLACS
jgi:hypothetical protein